LPQNPDPIVIQELIRLKASEHSIRIEPSALPDLGTHLSMVLRWAPATHITSISTPEEAVVRHVLESAVAASYVEPGMGPLLDVGAGNGYPALAIKCLLPALRVMLFEPALRKSIFLKQVASVLAMKDVEIHRKRLDRPEDVVPYGPFGTITMRAVAALAPVVDSAGLALRRGGRMILFLGRAKEEELLSRLSSPLELRCRAALPGRQRSKLIVVERIS
jgi:16S rRNA (guanine527-N7)-methyltransferase